MTQLPEWEKFSRDQFDAGYSAGYGAAMDDGWGEPGHIRQAVAATLDDIQKQVEDMPDVFGIRYSNRISRHDVWLLIENLRMP